MKELDVSSFLDDYEIPYVTSGKNVSNGWIEINCPYKDCGDSSFHMGINTESGLHHCWICGRKGGMAKLASEILMVSYHEAEEILSKYEGGIKIPEEKSVSSVKEVILKTKKEFGSLYSNYLIKRNYDPEFIRSYYGISAGGPSGQFSFRIVVPIIMNGKIVNYTARDVTGKQTPKYKNLPNEKAAVNMKDCLYNIDNTNDTVIITEGVFDVWRIGRGAVATMGKEFTISQIKMLHDKKIKRAFVMFDSDAEKHSEKIANILTSFVPTVEIIYINKKDPGELTEKEVKELRKELKLLG